ncbi:MAG: hypothetical protein MR292_10470 [Alistipes sp.]|nr:hypothetical protein [Alistipes sp.]
MINYLGPRDECALYFIATYIAQGNKTLSLDGLNYIIGVKGRITELYKNTINSIQYSWIDCLYYILFHSVYRSDYKRNQDDIPIISFNIEVLEQVKIYYYSIETEHRYNQIIQLLYFFNNADKNKRVLYFVVSLIHYITKDDIIHILMRLNCDSLFKIIIYSVGKDDIFKQLSNFREEGDRQIAQRVKQYQEEARAQYEDDIKLITNHPLYTVWLEDEQKKGRLCDTVNPELIKAFEWARSTSHKIAMPLKIRWAIEKEFENKLSKIKDELFSHLPEFAAQYIVRNQDILKSQIIEHDESIRLLLIMICRRIIEKQWLQGPMIEYQISAYCLGAYNLDISPSLLSGNRSVNLIESLIEQGKSV